MLRKIAKEKHTKYNKDKGISTTCNRGFPRDAVDKNMAANAGDTSSIPGLGRIYMPWNNQVPAPQLLGPRTTITEAKHEGPMLPDKRSHGNEKTVHHNKEKPLLCQQLTNN